MTEVNKDAPAELTQQSETDKERLYGDILRKEARSLLAQYLPEALPQEPTEILDGLNPFYMGKFKGRHYIQREIIILSHAQVAQQIEEVKRLQEAIRQYQEEEDAWIKLITEKLTSGEWTAETDFDKLEKQFFTTRQPPQPLPKLPPQDWEEPERLLKGYDQYSMDTWEGIYSLVHEQVHQRQAELNPRAFPQLSSPELDVLDPVTAPRSDLKRQLTEAHKSWVRTTNKDSLFEPVVEGMSVVGSFYVLGRLANDLMKSGQVDIATRIGQARNERIRSELVQTERNRRGGRDVSYNLHYVEGSRIIRKIYKQFGEQTPRILTAVDLNACREITKGSPQYQQIMENPALLPGLQKAV